MYYCQAVSCGEKGNLVTLEKFFGIEADPTLASQFKSREARLQQYQTHLTAERRRVLYEKGLKDTTIERFRIGYDPEHRVGDQVIGCYVIPYLDGRRPVAFRYYDPIARGTNEKGNTLYGGPNGSKYWWEAGSTITLYNLADGAGDTKTGRVFICEGELKAALLVQMGYCAVSLPGAGNFKSEWSQYFNHAKEIFVCLDNDNPEFHRHGPCNKCHTTEKSDCFGHNPGQEAAAKLMDIFGYRAKNIVLPLPSSDERKVDINEYFLRDANTKGDFEQLAYGLKNSPFVVRSLADIRKEPPPEAVFLVDQGLLPKGGRLLITGAPKAGKSIFVENLALSIAAGIPFLRRFNIANDGLTPGHRVLLLDRELSERSLFDRLNILIEDRPGYAAAEDKLLIDHKMQLKLDHEGAAETLISLIRANNAEVVILDTAYKFFTGDMENAKSVAKAFATLDEAILETGVSVILTHHHRKGGGQGSKVEAPSPDQVMGSFLWTGWPNGTVLLNFKDRSVSNPFTTIASFAAFRDAAPPDPLLLMRSRESIAYESITPYSFEEDDESQWASPAQKMPLNFDNVAQVLLEAVPVVEDEFLHMAGARFGCRPETVKLHLLDILDRHPDFVRNGDGSRGKPYVWKYKYEVEEETYEQEQERLGVQLGMEM